MWKFILRRLKAMVLYVAVTELEQELAEGHAQRPAPSPEAEKLYKKALAYLGEEPPALPAPQLIGPVSTPPPLPAPTPHLNGEQPRRPRGRPRKHPLPPSETHPDPDFADLS
jgi:hypothetical protein